MDLQKLAKEVAEQLMSYPYACEDAIAVVQTALARAVMESREEASRDSIKWHEHCLDELYEQRETGAMACLREEPQANLTPADIGRCKCVSCAPGDFGT